MANELKIPHVVVSLLYAFAQVLILMGYFAFKHDTYLYLGITIAILSFCYLLFMKKYFYLHASSSTLSK